MKELQSQIALKMAQKRRIGIVGYGHLGQYLTDAVLKSSDMELAFVWNRTKTVLSQSNVPANLVLDDLMSCKERKPDLIVEVAHPNITQNYGTHFLSVCDFLLGSPTALADASLESWLRESACANGLYVPSGALWGGEDIRKMDEVGSLRALKVTMTKHPSSFKMHGALAETLARADFSSGQPVTLFEGPVRQLCPLAPNNVNTMAAAAVAAQSLGLDKTMGKLVADPKLTDWHYVEVLAEGPIRANGSKFSVESIRKNPANPGAVTGTATFGSFLASIRRAKDKGPGIHLC